MERSLVERIRTFISVGDRYLEKGNLELACDSYLDALYALAVLIAYRDTGRLMPLRELRPFLSVKYPDVGRLIEKYSEMPSFDGLTASALRDEVTTLMGMMSLPSPEE